MSIQDLLYQYDQTRVQNEARRQARIDACMKRSVRIGSLLDDILTTTYTLVGAKLNRDKEAYDTLCKALASYEQEKRDILLELGYPANYLDPIYTCAKCKDTGYIDGAPCECLKQALLEARLFALNIDKAISFDAFDDGIYPGAKKLHTYFQAVVHSYPTTQHITYLLTGGTGTGKSFLLKCIAKEFARMGQMPLLCTAYAMFGQFHAHRLGQETDLDQYTFAPILLIDDLGCEPVTNNVTVEYFYNLINERYEKKLVTFLATNLTQKALESRYERRTISRLFDTQHAVLIQINGPDLRLR